MEQHRDEHIVCASCGTSFLFSAAEAAIYEDRKLAVPKRCQECRRARKEQRGRQDAASGQQSGYAPPWGAGGRRMDRAHPRAPRYTGDVNEYRSPMPDSYPAPAWASSSPPRQRGARPVRDDGIYRAPSFGSERGGNPGGAAWEQRPQRVGGGPTSEARVARGRPTFSIICKSCGAEGQVPFKPIEGRDVFCQACYRGRKSA